jgi:hypothetical protein
LTLSKRHIGACLCVNGDTLWRMNMTKYIVSFGAMPFSIEIATIFNGKGKPDFPAMFKRVKEWAKEGTVELASV